MTRRLGRVRRPVVVAVWGRLRRRAIRVHLWSACEWLSWIFPSSRDVRGGHEDSIADGDSRVHRREILRRISRVPRKGKNAGRMPALQEHRSAMADKYPSICAPTTTATPPAEASQA